MREFNADKWDTQYNFPAVQRGDVIKTEIPHGKPAGMTGFVMNTRKAPFDDWRVREALTLAFNFEFINDTVTGGAQPRITSYFSGSDLAMQPGPALGQVKELLLPFAGSCCPARWKGMNCRKAMGRPATGQTSARPPKLLAEAGWTVQDGVLRNAKAIPFR